MVRGGSELFVYFPLDSVFMEFVHINKSCEK